MCIWHSLFRPSCCGSLLSHHFCRLKDVVARPPCQLWLGEEAALHRCQCTHDSSVLCHSCYCVVAAQMSRKAKLADAPTRADSEAGRRADAGEQELRAATTRIADAEEAAAAHRQAHTDALIANAELQVSFLPTCIDPVHTLCIRLRLQATQ